MQFYCKKLYKLKRFTKKKTLELLYQKYQLINYKEYLKFETKYSIINLKSISYLK